VPYGCAATTEWVHNKERREIFVHAHCLFTEESSIDPLHGGRNGAFEQAVIGAYNKAFTELGVADDENPAVSLELRIVQ